MANPTNDIEGTITNEGALGDSLDIPLTISTSKLDADQYSADDLDGVTESLFGSGNMAYASLQASQTASAMNDSGADYFQAGTIDLGTNELPVINADRPIAGSDNLGADTLGNEGSYANTTVGTVGASALSTDAGSFSDSSNLRITPENFFRGGTSAAVRNGGNNNAQNNTNTDKANSITNNDNSAVTNNNMSVNNNTVVNEGDEINNVFDDDIIDNTTEIINNTTDNVTEIINNTTEIVTNITDNVTNIVNNVTDNLTEIVNTVTTNITNIVTEILGGEISLNLDLNALDTLITNLNLTIDDSIEGGLSVSTVTTNITTIINEISGLDVPLLGDLNLDIGFNLLSGEDVNDGNDIMIGNFEVPIDLDILEDIIGDLDINLALPQELLDPSLIVSNLITTVNSLDDLDPASINEILGVVGDQAIDGALDLVLGNTGLSESFDVTLEEAVGEVTDIVTEITNGAGDLLDGLTGGATDEITDNLDNTIEAATDAVEDIADNLLSGELDLGTLGDVVDEATELTGDILDTLTGDLSGDVTDTLEGGVDNVTDALDTVTDGLLNNELELEDIGNLTEETMEVIADSLDTLTGGGTSDITDGLEDAADLVTDGLLGGDADMVWLVDLVDNTAEGLESVLDHLTGGATGELTDALTEATDELTDAVDNTLGGLTDFADDLLDNPFDNLLGGDNNNGTDSDITADLGVDILENSLVDDALDIALDPVEDLLGDVDLDLGLNTDLLGGGDGANDPNDTDITLDTNIELVDDTIADITEDIPLDTVEAITGDIDLDLGAGVDLLGDLAAGVVNNGEGGTGEDTILADLGDTLGDTVGTITEELLSADDDFNGAADIVDDLTGGLTNELSDTLNDGLEEVLNDDALLEGDITAETIDDTVTDLADALDDMSGGATEELTGVLEDSVDTVTDTVDDIIDGVLAGDGDLGGLTDIIEDTVDVTGGLIDEITGGATEDITDGLDDVIDHVLSDNDIDDLVGDITDNLDLGDALDLLGGGGAGDDDGGLLDGLGGESDWTESIIGDGGLFGDVLGGGGGGSDGGGLLGGLLPEPSGSAGEGFGILDPDSSGGGGLFGGLFG